MNAKHCLFTTKDLLHRRLLCSLKRAGYGVLAWAFAPGLQGVVALPALFSDHAIVQRSNNTRIWGTADAGEAVSVRLGTVHGETSADAQGRWSMTLDLSALPDEPLTLRVSGENEIVVSDVLLGEVWLCSGQSNMAFRMRDDLDFDSAGAALVAGTGRMIRQFVAVKKPADMPQEDLDGKWIVADSVESLGGFTAVGFYFAQSVASQTGRAVGLLDASIGGTPLEAWLSDEGFADEAVLCSSKDRILEELHTFPERLKRYRYDYAAWTDAHERQDVPTLRSRAYTRQNIDDVQWRSVIMPAALSPQGLPDAGAVWLRKELEIPEQLDGSYLVLLLGDIRGFYWVWWNGELVGQRNERTGGTGRTRITLPKVEQGTAVLTVRLFNPVGDMGIDGGGYPMRAGETVLDGEWKIRTELEFSTADVAAREACPQLPALPPAQRDAPTYLYNGLIHPLTPATIAGVLWYQGESNTSRAAQYGRSFPLLIEDWRRQFSSPELPFYYCQLAGYGAYRQRAGDSMWGELREAQGLARSLPKTGQAVLIDIGEEADIHFRSKRPVGERLARLALANNYGVDVPYLGPMLERMQPEGESIRLYFSNSDGGLVARELPAEYRPRSSATDVKPLHRNSPGGEVEGFAICGEDRNWVWADAVIDGESVIVSSPLVQEPIAIRYGWADMPLVNLYNADGLPAEPFRTDDFSLTTAERMY